jgi:hypothetical protein
MSAVARLSAVAGDDVAIVVVLPAGFTTGKTFALQLRRRNGALVHTATPTVAGDNVLIEIPAAKPQPHSTLAGSTGTCR